jgi:hypothetical protein
MKAIKDKIPNIVAAAHARAAAESCRRQFRDCDLGEFRAGSTTFRLEGSQDSPCVSGEINTSLNGSARLENLCEPDRNSDSRQ